jgi:hypothetical protein
VLPPYGFVIQSPMLVAWHSRSFQGQNFAEPTFVVVRSLDGRPITSSGRLRFFRALGDRQIRWDGKTLDLDEELIVTRTNP